MKKIFNFRPLWVGVISLIITIIIVSCKVFFDTLIANIFFVSLIVGASVLLVVLIVELICKKNCGLVAIVSILLAIFLGSTSTVIILKSNTVEYDGEVSISGEVCNVSSYTKVDLIVLDDVIINDQEFDGKVELKCFNLGNTVVKLGDNVSTIGELVEVSVTYENLYYIAENIDYILSCDSNDIVIADGGYNFRVEVSNGVKNNLELYLNKTNAAIAFSALFGIKDGMPTETYNMFSYAGIAHILAVSGLHIGFLVSVISLLLKLLNCKRNIKNIIIIILLVLYAYLCDFTASVTRAVIMSIVLLLSKSYKKEYDSLNAVSLAAIIILLTNPLNLFMSGFQLSFISVFSIATLAGPIERLLSKIKCPAKLSETISMSLSVNIGLLCVSAQQFNQINFISILSNIIVIPIFSSCFCVLFLISFIGLLLPFINYLLVLPNILLHFIRLIANLFCNINFLNFELFRFSYIFVAISILIAYIFHFALISKKSKGIICGALAIVIIVCGILVNNPISFNQNYAITSSTLQGNYVLLANKNNDRCLVINGITNKNEIVDALNNKNISYLDSIVVNKYSYNQFDLINDLIVKYKVDDLYISQIHSLQSDSFSDEVNIHYITNQFNVNGIQFEILGGFIQDNFGLLATIDNQEILLLNSNANAKELNNYFMLKNDFDIVITLNYTKSLLEYNINANIIDNQTIQNLSGENLFALS